jgi:hypothetical protein
MNTNTVIYIALGCVVLLTGWLGYTEWRLKKIFRGKKAGDLEDILQFLGNDLKNLQTGQRETEDYLKEAEERLKKSLKKVGIVRYNPYGETAGSNQSFSLAFLDEQGNGAVISTLYTRDNIKTYAKPIKEYKSEHTLTPEENEAIWKTKN